MGKPYESYEQKMKRIQRMRYSKLDDIAAADAQEKEVLEKKGVIKMVLRLLVMVLLAGIWAGS
jgi:hypothetical protein